jgi:C1A family cysteine protease
MFESDTDSETMKAYMNFLAQHKKLYADIQTTADRYKIFKANYQMIQNHNKHADVLPFVMEVNVFADFTIEEFLEHHRLRVPRHLLLSSQSYSSHDRDDDEHSHHNHDTDDHVHSRGHGHHHSQRFDKVDESLPVVKNWFEEGAVSEPYDQKQCGSCWAFTTASTLNSAIARLRHHKRRLRRRLDVQRLLLCFQVWNNGQGGIPLHWHIR